MTGLPVRRAYPAGDAISAPTVALPTISDPQPTPAQTRKRLSCGMYFRTLAKSALSPPFRHQACGFIKKFTEWGSFERKHAKVAESLLLSNPQAQCFNRKFRLPRSGRGRFDGREFARARL